MIVNLPSHPYHTPADLDAAISFSLQESQPRSISHLCKLLGISLPQWRRLNKQSDFHPITQRAKLAVKALSDPQLSALVTKVTTDTALAGKDEVTLQHVVEALSYAAFGPIQDLVQWDADRRCIGVTASDKLTPPQAAVISQVNIDEDGMVSFQRFSREKALELLAKHKGAFTDDSDRPPVTIIVEHVRNTGPDRKPVEATVPDGPDATTTERMAENVCDS